MDSQLKVALIILTLGLLFWAVRAILWWYYGIDRTVAALERIADTLDRFEDERLSARNAAYVRRVSGSRP